MANDNDSVDSNGNSGDLRPRRSNRAKGKPTAPVEETDDNIVVNNVAYKVGDFAFYLDKKQDIYRIGLIEEFKFQKRDKLTNKKAEISLKQFYRLDEIPPSVLSNEGEFDTHVMPQNFPEWLRLRELFISDNTLATPSSSLRGMCTVRHFPDLNHAMALFSSTQSSNINSSGSPRADHHSLINNKDGNIPVPKQRDDNTFFYVYSYNARGRKLAATYLEIRVGATYQAELPDLRSPDDKSGDENNFRVWEQLMWKPNQIPEEVFNVYNMATISIACFSGFGGGVDDSASVENGRKIASHMLTRQKALDCLHKAQYNMEKAMEIFAENSLPETNKMPFLWTDEDHIMFDESVKIYGKNFLRINQDKRNKKSRLVGDFVTFYYYWKKNRPKNRKYAAKKNLRSRIPNVPLSEQNENADNPNMTKQDSLALTSESDKPDKSGDPNNPSPSEPVQEFCTNCKSTLPKTDPSDEKFASLTERMKVICAKCQHYLRRYGYQRPVEISKRKCSDNEEDGADFEDEGLNGFDEEEDEEEQEGDEDDEEEVFTSVNSPVTGKEVDENPVKSSSIQSSQAVPLDNKNTLAINKYDFDEEDENVEEVSSLLKRNQAKHNIMRDLKPNNFSSPQSGSSNSTNSSNNSSNQIVGNKAVVSKSITTETPPKLTNKRTSILKGKPNNDNSKKRKLEPGEEIVGTKSSCVVNRASLLNSTVTKQFHESLKSNLSHSHSTIFGKKVDQKKSGPSDSNSSSSSTSSSSNDSSSSDEGESLPLTKKSVSNVKFPPGSKIDSNKDIKLESGVSKDQVDSSYNQMITAVPNLPGVCAVTNIGEPMPQMMQNISTDLSSSQNSSVSDLNITLAEPLYKQFSIRTPTTISATTTATSSSSSVNTESSLFTALPKQTSTNTHNPIPTPSDTPIVGGVSVAAKLVNFNSISTQPRPQSSIDTSNPEETGLNLVKPKKRAETVGYSEHNWAPPHDSPSKLVHYRGDSSITGATGATASEANLSATSACAVSSAALSATLSTDSHSHNHKQHPQIASLINGNEVVHSSRFGCIVRSIKQTDGYSCARTDLHHTTSGLRPDDIERRQQYINAIKTDESPTGGGQIQDLGRHKISGSMPPPTDKMHHPSSSLSSGTVKHHLTTPPLTHSHSLSTQSAASSISSASTNPSGGIPSPAHSRKMSSNPSHTLRSPSPAASARSQPSFSSGSSSNLLRSSHLHNMPLMTTTSNAAVAPPGVNNIRPPPQLPPSVLMSPNIQSVPNNSLLIDYVNMNKVANDLMIYQAIAQNYEEMQKQEIQKYLLNNMPISTNNLLNRAMWEQRDRFVGSGVGIDAWMNSMPPGSMPPPSDLQSIMRAINQSQNAANTQNRPRSATGLNLSSMNNPQSLGLNQGSGVAGSSGQSGSSSSDKPGSGRASVNHISGEFQRPDSMSENSELMDILRFMAESHMNNNAASPLISMLNLQKSVAGMHHQQGPPPPPPPPSAHALNSLVGGPGVSPGFPSLSNQHLAGVQPSFLSQMQAAVAAAAAATSQNQPTSVKPPISSFPPSAGGQRPNIMDIYQYCQLNPFTRNPPR